MQEEKIFRKSRSRWARSGSTDSGYSSKLKNGPHKSPVKKKTHTKRLYLRSRNQWGGTKREITSFVQTQTILIPDPCSPVIGVWWWWYSSYSLMPSKSTEYVLRPEGAKLYAAHHRMMQHLILKTHNKVMAGKGSYEIYTMWLFFCFH